MSQRRLFTLKKFLLVLAVVGIGYVGRMTWGIYHEVTVTIPHSYAAWTTGDLIVEYMDTHKGKWPRSWDDLRESKASLVQKGRAIYFDFDKLPAIVKVDWQANPEMLVKTLRSDAQTNLKVVTQLDGSKLEAQWGVDTEPNRKIARYLSEKP